jgi:outer membrane receptor for ferrienterochelin and colicins
LCQKSDGMKQIISLLLFSAIGISAFPQNDTLFNKTLNELVVTATRTERKLGNVAVPVQIISNKAIRASGSLRVNDILAEQTGLYITSAGATTSAGGGVFGNGVQIQGLSPDYTLVLLDGEPIIGRQGGVIDLTRLTVGNIKKIEVVKGPSSSLYGSEAMGGVVNIITEQGQINKLDASFRYGRFGSADASISAALKKEKWALQLFGNRNRSQGFDLDENTPEKTVDPFGSYTSQLRFSFHPTEKTRISLSGRYYHEVQDNYFQTPDISSGNIIAITGDGRIRDMNLNPVITQQFTNKLRSSLRFYFSRYEYEQALSKEADKSSYYYDFFRQDFFRIENQTDVQFPKNNFITLGAGLVQENLNTNRYAGHRENSTRYLFLQDEWRTSERLTIIGGMRYDDNSAYQSKLSPKLAVHYKVNEKLRLNASYGAGFKAPDFRQLFLNFLNTAAGGYVVYGANEITAAALQEQKQQGLISDILPRAWDLALLKPEISKGFNAGARYDVNEHLNFTLGLFRNDIENLIQVDVIAFRNNAAPVYSYFNVKKAYTQGVEFNTSYRLSNYLQVQGGYQFLMTADKDDLKMIEDGKVFTRDLQTGEVSLVSTKDYAGLPNRSKHMANAKLFYENEKKGWAASLRVVYRSRWGTYDKDGNGIINREDEFADGSAVFNINASKKIKSFRLQAGIDNLFNYKDVINLPGQPGIQPYFTVFYSFIKN